jgi:hypothetical protein
MRKTIDLHSVLIKAGETDLNDWFSFEVNNTNITQTDQIGGTRFNITAFLDTRVFEPFHLDVNTSDILVQPVSILPIPNLLEFAGFPPTHIRCYSIEQQIAEKVHALTRGYTSGEVSRVKDFIDILLLARINKIHMKELRNAIEKTFSTRNTHKMPTSAPQINRQYFRNYAKLAKEVNLIQKTAIEGNKAIVAFLSPVLSSESYSSWDPRTWAWRK